jgi:transposase
MEEVDDRELVVERVAALDLGQGPSGGVCAGAAPTWPGRSMQELRGHGTTTAQLVEMATWLRHWHVARVVIESTSTY